MKVFGVVMIVGIAVAMMFVAGCTDSVSPQNEVTQPSYSFGANPKLASSVAASEASGRISMTAAPYFAGGDQSNGKYDQAEVVGRITNPTDKIVKVFGYVDYYQNGVKIDSGIFSCTPDAKGTAQFKSSSFDVKGDFTYTVRITDVYKV